MISVNECDPLRDEGIEFYRLLLRAGVHARCRQVMGTIHGTEIFPIAVSRHQLATPRRASRTSLAADLRWNRRALTCPEAESMHDGASRGRADRKDVDVRQRRSTRSDAASETASRRLYGLWSAAMKCWPIANPKASVARASISSGSVM